MKNLPKDTFDSVLHLSLQKAKTVIVENKRDVYKAIIDGELRLLSKPVIPDDQKLTPKELGAIRSVKSQFEKFAKSKDYKIDPRGQNYGSRQKNKKLWNELEIGEAFYLVDVKHAYWRIAYKLGYISQKVYKKYLPNDYKLSRNIALASTIAPKFTQKYENGILVDEIKENTRHFEIMYEHIRYSCYDLVGSAYGKFIDQSIGYVTDGIYVMPEVLQQVKDYFRNRGFLYHSSICCKTNEKEISEGNRIKRF